MSNGRKNRGDKDAPFKLRRPELIEAESAPVDLPKMKAPPKPDLSGIGGPASPPRRKKAEADLVPVQGGERKKSADPDMIPITGHGLSGTGEMVEGEAGPRKADADMVAGQGRARKAEADMVAGQGRARKAGGDLKPGAAATPKQAADLVRGRERQPKKAPDIVSAADLKRRSATDSTSTQREPRAAAELVRSRARDKNQPDMVSAGARRRGAEAEMSSAEREARTAADFVRNRLGEPKKAPDMVSAADLKRRGAGGEMHRIEREPRAGADLVRGRHGGGQSQPSIVRSASRPGGTSAGKIVRDITRRRGTGATLVRQPGDAGEPHDPAAVLQSFVDELRDAAERNRADIEIVLLAHMTVDFAKGHRTLRVTFPVTELTYDRVRIRDSQPPPPPSEPALEPEPEQEAEAVRETAGLLARFGNMLRRRTQLDKATDAPVDVVSPTAAAETGPPRHSVALTARYIDPAKQQDWIVELISDRSDAGGGAPKVAPPGPLTAEGLKRRFLPLLGSLLTALDTDGHATA